MSLGPDKVVEQVAFCFPGARIGVNPSLSANCYLFPQAQDPFPGPAPVPVEVAQKFCRIDKSKKVRTSLRVEKGCSPGVYERGRRKAAWLS